MKYFTFNKLVRDKIISNMNAHNQQPFETKTLNDEEFISELSKKVAEEASELAGASSKEELKEELADVVEVIEYLKKMIGVSDLELELIQEKKTAKNGGFLHRDYIGYVGVSEDNQWYEYYLKNPDKYPPKNL